MIEANKQNGILRNTLEYELHRNCQMYFCLCGNVLIGRKVSKMPQNEKYGKKSDGELRKIEQYLGQEFLSIISDFRKLLIKVVSIQRYQL